MRPFIQIISRFQNETFPSWFQKTKMLETIVPLKSRDVMTAGDDDRISLYQVVALVVDYCVSRRLDYFGIVLEGDLGNLGIVLAGNLDLNSCLFYY